MEIREGLRYEYLPGQYATIKQCLSEPNSFYAVFDAGGISSSFTQRQWIKDFKSGNIKLIEYPYQVCDWVYCINDRYSNQSTPKVTQITEISQGTTQLIHVNNETGYLKVHDFNLDWRPCFKDEIPGKIVKPKKEKKEDYSYLVDLFRERGIT